MMKACLKMIETHSSFTLLCSAVRQDTQTSTHSVWPSLTCIAPVSQTSTITAHTEPLCTAMSTCHVQGI